MYGLRRLGLGTLARRSRMQALARRSNRLTALVLAGVAVLSPAPALAWGNEGHRIIALVAYTHLAPATRAAVDEMLRNDTDALTEPDIASRATWADKYRDSDRHTSQERYRLTRAWHFVDIELDHPDLAAACYGHPPSAVPASLGPAQACVVDRIEAFMAELRNSRPSPERTIAFKFLLHLIGDVHQPLHAADNHDAGGNGVLVLFGRRTVGRRLHAYWDADVVRRLGRDPVSVAARIDARFGTACNGWMRGTAIDWALETFAVARDFVYQLGEATTDEHDAPAYRLTSGYQHHAADVAAEQLEKASCRLAMVLNQTLQQGQ